MVLGLLSAAMASAFVACAQAFYLPLVFLVISLCMGGDWLGELMGVLVGHLCAPKSQDLLHCMTSAAMLQQRRALHALLTRATHAGPCASSCCSKQPYRAHV